MKRGVRVSQTSKAGDLELEGEGRRAVRDRANEPLEVRRRQLREDGLCITCEQPSPTQRCAECRGVIEANTERDRGRAVKGPPTKIFEDGFDLGQAVRELTDGRCALLEAYAMPDGLARREAIKVALAKVALGARFANHVVERRSGGAANRPPLVSGGGS